MRWIQASLTLVVLLIGLALSKAGAAEERPVRIDAACGVAHDGLLGADFHPGPIPSFNLAEPFDSLILPAGVRQHRARPSTYRRRVRTGVGLGDDGPPVHRTDPALRCGQLQPTDHRPRLANGPGVELVRLPLSEFRRGWADQAERQLRQELGQRPVVRPERRRSTPRSSAPSPPAPGVKSSEPTSSDRRSAGRSSGYPSSG